MSIELPRYQTSDPTEFKAFWTLNPEGTWLVVGTSQFEDGGVICCSVRGQLVMVGAYQDVYAEALRRFPVRNATQGVGINPIEVVNVG